MVSVPGPNGRSVDPAHNGVFKSEDGATTFREITDIDPAVFGFAVAVHTKDSQTAWLAPRKRTNSACRSTADWW